MPRDINGNYTLPAGNPVVALSTITSTWANDTLDDIAQALTDSLDITDPATARTILELGTIATQDASSVAVTGGTIAGVQLSNYNELKQDVTATATLAISYSAGQIVKLSQDLAITTLSFTNVPTTGKGAALTIVRVKDNTGTARLITWPASVKWMNGVAPTLTATANGVDIINLITYDGGTTWYGTYATGFA